VFVASELAPVLRDVLLLAILAVRRDHLYALVIQVIMQRVAVVRVVADDAMRCLGAEHELEQALHELGFVRACAARGHRHRQAAGIYQDHDFHAISRLGEPHAVAPRRGPW